MFRFKLGEMVLIDVSKEKGEVIGRADYKSGKPQYLVRYRAADGRAVETWWNDDALTAA